MSSVDGELVSGILVMMFLVAAIIFGRAQARNTNHREDAADDAIYQEYGKIDREIYHLRRQVAQLAERIDGLTTPGPTDRRDR